MLVTTDPETGEAIIRLTNLSYKPLDFPKLVDSIQNNRTTAITTVEGDLCDEEENIVGDRVTTGCEIKLNQRVPFFCLVDGGVLPPAYLSGTENLQLLLDKNVIGMIQSNAGIYHDQLKKLDVDSFTFNVMLACFEGGERRCPTADEMVVEFQEFHTSVSGFFNKASVTGYSVEQLDELHKFREDFEPSHEKEENFFRQVAPIIANTIRADQLDSVKEQVVSTADSTGLEKDSFLFAATLSKLYENYESCGNVANKVLKPRDPMSDEDLYNVVADLRHLKILAASRALCAGTFVMLTDDTGLAMLWAGLQVTKAQGGDGGFSVDFCPHEDLFPRANFEVIKDLLSC